MKNKLSIISMIVITLSGCTSNNHSAQVEDKHNMVFTKNGAMEVIRIYPNDTIESIAKQKNVPVEILTAVNRLSYPYHLHSLRTILVPYEQYHTIKNTTESLKIIARQYRVDLMQLMDINNMTHVPLNKFLNIGTIIKIPSNKNYIKQHIEPVEPQYQATQDYDVMALDEVEETLVVSAKSTYETQSVTEESIVHNTTAEFEKDLHQILDSNPEPQVELPPQNNNTFKTSTPLNSQNFVWPLSGNISREKKDGIIIFAPLNTVVRAAGSGKVIFADHDNAEYGNLIIIKHFDGYLSAYAYNNQMLVKKGDDVLKGQGIAKVGKSGKASKTQLFFSMRQGKESIDVESDIMH